MKTAEDLLGDLSGFRNFRKDASDLLEELVNWRQDTFDEWSRDIQAQIDDPNAPIRLAFSPVLLLYFLLCQI